MKLTSLQPRVQTVNVQRGAPAAERIRGRKLQRIRDRILLRDEYTCRKCGHVSSRLEVDHIVPLHLGGVESDSNRQALCKRCHKIKSDREESGRGLG